MMYWTLGWSDLALFAIFAIGHIAAECRAGVFLFFMSSIPKNRQISLDNFSFSKNHRDLKNKYFFFKIPNKKMLTIFFTTKTDKMVVDL